MLMMTPFYEWMCKLILSEPQTALAKQLMAAFISTVESKPLGGAPHISPCKPETAGRTHSTHTSPAESTTLLQ